MPPSSPRRSGATSGGLIHTYRTEDAETIVIALGSVLGTIKDAVDRRREAGERVGVVGITSFRPFPFDAVRDALARARSVIVIEKAFSVGFGGVLSTDVAMATHDDGAFPPNRHRRVSADVRSPTTRSKRCSRRPPAIGCPVTFLDLDLEHRRARTRPDRRGRDDRSLGGEHPARPRHRRVEDRMRSHHDAARPVRFYQVGSFAVGNRLLDDADRTVQSDPHRSNSLDSGHRACQGCGEALGARYALDAAMRATGGQLIAVNATGCLEVFSTPYPETSWRIAWLHSLFGNAPAVATGVAAAMKVKGKTDVRVVAQAGDGGTVDIGFGCLSGMFERNDDVLFICYDNEAYMNTGVQRSGATPPAARTATTEAIGPEPGNVFGQGKDMPRLAMAHGIDYVATATVADLHDLEAKVERAMSSTARATSTCSSRARSAGGRRRATPSRSPVWPRRRGLFPVFEAEHGEVTDRLADPASHTRRGRTCRSSAATGTSSVSTVGPTSSPASRRSPTRTSRPMASRRATVRRDPRRTS